MGLPAVHRPEVETSMPRSDSSSSSAGYGASDGNRKALGTTTAHTDADGQSLQTFCREQLAHYKAPSRVEFVPELPRSDRGKILRRVLRRVWMG